jgi:hypothetical protein
MIVVRGYTIPRKIVQIVLRQVILIRVEGRKVAIGVRTYIIDGTIRI